MPSHFRHRRYASAREEQGPTNTYPRLPEGLLQANNELPQDQQSAKEVYEAKDF